VYAPDVPLETAAWEGNTSAVRQHIEAGTDLNWRNPMSGSTPLLAATTRGNTEAAKLLIDAGADLDAVNNDGSTALHVAAFLCRKEIAAALLADGARTDMRNRFGHTPADSVTISFEEAKPGYDMLVQVLGPMGLELDFERIQRERPEMAEMLRQQ